MNKFKKLFINFLAVLLAVQGALYAQLFLLTPPSVKAADNTPEVVINEIMWESRDSGGSHASDDWIELYNPTSQEKDVNGWVLTQVASGGDLTISGAPMMAAGDYLMIAHNLPGPTSVLAVTPDVHDTSLSISDTCPSGGVSLLDETSTEVDHLDCFGSSWPAGLSNGLEARAMERDYPVTDQELWHTSVGFINMIDEAQGRTYATPGFTNDRTNPIPGTIEVNASQFETTTLKGNWTGFNDSESGQLDNDNGIDHYVVFCSTVPKYLTAPCPGVGGLVVLPGDQSSYEFTDKILTPGVPYYFNIWAVNKVGLPNSDSDDIINDMVVSSGTTVPQTPVLAVKDTENDAGGSLDLLWDDGTSDSSLNYTVYYKETTQATWQQHNNVTGKSYQLTGLKNQPVCYDVKVQATDSNNVVGPESNVEVDKCAIDNQAPVLDRTKIIVKQNQPGVNDQIMGLAGAANKSEVEVSVFNVDPNLGGLAIASLQANSDGGFNLVDIGDNQNSQLYLRLANLSDPSKVSQTEQFGNDIVGPQPAHLETLEANCDANPCRVIVDWQNSDPDAQAFDVAYTVDGSETRVKNLSTTSLVLYLPVDKTYDFAVYSFDEAGNASQKSNVLSIHLTQGVRTDVSADGSGQITRTRGISGSLATSQAALPSQESLLIPPAQAAEPSLIVTPTASPSPTETNTAGESNSDWVRIFVVIIILLIIAGSFYALSRSINEDNPDTPIPPKAKGSESKTDTSQSQNSQKRSNRRNRRRR